MKVGIIGTGNVGSALATGLTAAGHDAVVGSRDPESNRVEDAEVVTQRAAAAHGDVVLLAVPPDVAADVAEGVRDALADKPVVDVTNEYPTATADEPVAVRVADAVPEAHLVKAFNTVGANLMADPVVDGEAATMFLAGDDSEAVDVIATLAGDLGFEPVVAGDLAAAGHLEHLARFWIDLSQEYGRDTAFKLLREGTDAS